MPSRTAIGRATLWTACVALVAAPGSAHAKTLGPGAPLLDRLASGGELPREIRVRVVARELAFADRSLTGREAVLLRALAVAQANDDPAPFREAFSSGSPWLREVALEGLAYGRLARGNESHLEALRAARAQDAAFVAQFLPELATLARSAPGGEDTYFSTVPGRAATCLALLARLSRVGEVRARATNALVAGIVELRRPEAVDALGFSYMDDPGDPPRPIALGDEHRAALRPVLERWIARGETRAGYGAPILLGLVVAAVDPGLADPLYRVGKGRALGWTEALARVGYGPAIADARDMARRGAPQDLAAFDMMADTVADASLAHLVARRLAAAQWFHTERIGTLVAALERLGRQDLLEAQVKRDLEHGDSSRLAHASAALLRLDPAAATWLRAALPRLPDGMRAPILYALIRAGEAGLAERAAAIAGSSADAQTNVRALQALGAEARRTGADADIDRLIGPPGRAGVLLALREAGRLTEKAERHLVDEFEAASSNPSFVRGAIAEVLGELGGPVSEAALRRACSYHVERKRDDLRQLRIDCREAVGRIEARTRR